MNRASVFLLCAGTVFAQRDSKAPAPAKGQEMTMTGCLNKAKDVPQHYSFVDQKTGKNWTVTGAADLEKHSANYTVTLTGAETAKVFAATKVQHVAATCDAKAGSGSHTK
jgi:hypothetical protein